MRRGVARSRLGKAQCRLAIVYGGILTTAHGGSEHLWEEQMESGLAWLNQEERLRIQM